MKKQLILFLIQFIFLVLGLHFISFASASISTSGATITTDGLWTVYKFLGNGTFNTTSQLTNITIMAIAGGGAGGSGQGGGGGAGSYINTTINITGNNTVTIGRGGIPTGGAGGNGFNTTAFSLNLRGGGGGGASDGVGQSGGSGGGGGASGVSQAGGSAIPAGFGQNGGSSSAGGSPRRGGGGGGAIGVGANGVGGGSSANGGLGAWNNINGTNITWANGGKGGSNSGEAEFANATNGTGNGGGGGNNIAGAYGGSGILILRVFSGVVITLNSPANNSQVVNPVTLNWTSVDNSETGLINTTLYINGTLNQTISLTGTTNTTTVSKSFSTLGNYNWTVESCTATVCSNSSTNIFTVSPYVANSQTYNNQTQETLTEQFSLNITLSPGFSLDSALLYYNGTSYSANIFSSGSIRIINRSIVIPNISSQFNATFFWSLNINNGSSTTNYNTTGINQTINTLALDNCGVNTHLILNYTIRDEDARTLMPVSQNITANVFVSITGDLSGETYEFYSASVTNQSIPVCVSNALLTGQNYFLDSRVQYTASNYVTEYYIIDNYTLNTSVAPKNVSLFLLLSSRSTEFLITYKNSYLVPVDGAIIELTREYLQIPGFLTVEVSETDADGQTVQHFVINEQFYTIYVKKDGVLLATFERVQAFCSDVVTGDCKINLNQLSSTGNPSDFSNILGVITTSSYNTTSKVFTVSFTSVDNTPKNVTVQMLKYSANNNESICTSSLSSSSGTITCTVPQAYYNDTAIVKLFVDGTQGYSIFQPINVNPGSQQNSGRFILGALLILTIPLIGISSGIMTLVLFCVGLATAGALHLVELGGIGATASSLLWLFVVAVILIVKAVKRREQI